MKADAEEDPTIDTNARPHARLLIDQSTLIAIGEMFEVARNIMEWLRDCEKIIAMANEFDVGWTIQHRLPSSLHISIQCNSMQCEVNRFLEMLSLVKLQIKTSLQVLTIQRETDKVEPQYSGARIEGDVVTLDFVKKMMDDFRSQKCLHNSFLKVFILKRKSMKSIKSGRSSYPILSSDGYDESFFEEFFAESCSWMEERRYGIS